MASTCSSLSGTPPIALAKTDAVLRRLAKPDEACLSIITDARSIPFIEVSTCDISS